MKIHHTFIRKYTINFFNCDYYFFIITIEVFINGCT